MHLKKNQKVSFRTSSESVIFREKTDCDNSWLMYILIVIVLTIHLICIVQLCLSPHTLHLVYVSFTYLCCPSRL